MAWCRAGVKLFHSTVSASRGAEIPTRIRDSARVTAIRLREDVLNGFLP